jgi:UDP-N-acetylmuramate--alanine ligase
MSKIFFSGIGGSGMSALAVFAADRGHTVAGSDRSFESNPGQLTCGILKNKGISVVPHDGSGIDASYDFAVFSTAVESNQPEVIKAGDLGIPMKTRPQYLIEIASGFRTVAVAGTSGKSTTAGMLAFLMDQLGLHPNFIGGGRVKQFRTPYNPGNSLARSSDILVIEACEADGSIVDYRPRHSIISSLSLDHNPVERTAGMFEILGRNTEKLIIINGDDRNLSRCAFEKPVRFSVDHDAEYRAQKIGYRPFETVFCVRGIKCRLRLPGKHNLYNALSCIALLSEMGTGIKDIAEILPVFSGIERRFDIHLNDGRHLVLDDYAHNPHKIECMMETVRKIARRVCYIFQPHGFGPTLLLKQGYVETFTKNLRKEDYLFLLPIYYAGGTPAKDISSEDLCDEISAKGKSVAVLRERSFLFPLLKDRDAYVVFGARDETLSDFAREIAGRLR